MGSMNVYDDGSQSWGSIGSGFASAIMGAPEKAAAFTHTIETIKDMRIKRAREEEANAAATALANSIDAETPAAYVAPRAYTAADISNPAVLDAPLSVTDRVSGSFGGADVPNGLFTDPRALALAEARRNTAILGTKAAVMKDPSQWAAQSAYAENATTGMPANPADRYRVQFGTTGRYPTAEESKTPNAQNFAIVNEDGTATGQGFASLNAGRTAIDGTPIVLKPGQRLMETGPAPLQVSNPLKDAAAAREQLAVLSKSVGPDGPTPEQVAQASQLTSVAYPPKRTIEQDPTNAALKVIKHVQEEPIPPWVISMLQPRASAAPVAAAPGGAAVAAAAPAPDAATNPNADRVVQPMAGSPDDIRKEYQALPEIKNYQTAANTWNALVQSAYTGNKSEDLNIVYSFVKLLDSLTGVRDAEVKMVGQVGSWPEQLNTLIGQANGSGLDTQTRANILATIQKHIGEIEQAARAKESFYTDVAKNNRLAPAAVLAQLTPLMQYDPGRVLAVGTDRAMPPPPSNPAVTTSPEDVKAREWATDPANRNTPEAKAILQHLNTR
jgi:hypothetical protein